MYPIKQTYKLIMIKNMLIFRALEVVGISFCISTRS